MPAQESADLGIRRQNNGQWSVRGLPPLGSGKTVSPNLSKPNQGKWQEIQIKILGFPWFYSSDSRFFNGLSDSKSKNFFSQLFVLPTGLLPNEEARGFRSMAPKRDSSTTSDFRQENVRLRLSNALGGFASAKVRSARRARTFAPPSRHRTPRWQASLTGPRRLRPRTIWRRGASGASRASQGQERARRFAR
jgi:hypothetical protein